MLGIAKAYTTRVGEGPFPTELDDEIGERSASAAASSAPSPAASAAAAGSTRCWCARPCAPRGIDGIALTKLDVLDGFEEIKVCVGYRLDGETIDYLPASQGAQARVEPVYETMEGWSGTTAGARSWAELPAQAIKYVRRIEELIGAPVALAVDQPRARRHDPDAGSVRGVERAETPPAPPKDDMAEYYPLIARAVAIMGREHARKAQARSTSAPPTALLGQLRALDPPVEEADIERERVALEDAVRRVETEAAGGIDRAMFDEVLEQARLATTLPPLPSAPLPDDENPPDRREAVLPR